MNEGVSAGREAAIAAYGAEVVRVPGSFDEAVLRCFADAESLGHFPIADHELGTYKDVPRRITQGYALVADEVVTELRGHAPPTHVFVPGGSGKLASAICGHLWEQYEYDRPRVITVEPVASACLVQSARAGKAIEISGEAQTVMDGLVVGQASAQAWEILGDARSPSWPSKIRPLSTLCARPPRAPAKILRSPSATRAAPAGQVSWPRRAMQICVDSSTSTRTAGWCSWSPRAQPIPRCIEISSERTQKRCRARSSS